MEIIASHKTKEYNFSLVDEKERTQKLKHLKTDKEYFLTVSDFDITDSCILHYKGAKYQISNIKDIGTIGNKIEIVGEIREITF